MLSSRFALFAAVFLLTFAANVQAYAGGVVDDTLHAVGNGAGKVIGAGVRDLGKIIQPPPAGVQVPPAQPAGCTGQKNCAQPEK